MSNCCEIKNPAIYFTKRELDVESFMEQVMKHQDHDTFAKPDSKACGINPMDWRGSMQVPGVIEWGDCQMFYWYLTPKNIFIKGDLLTIALGHGKSAHTFRDLRGTLDTLNKYVMVYKRFRVQMRDVDDRAHWKNMKNKQGWSPMDIVLGPGVAKSVLMGSE